MGGQVGSCVADGLRHTNSLYRFLYILPESLDAPAVREIGIGTPMGQSRSPHDPGSPCWARGSG
jgi:hypothetical protein